MKITHTSQSLMGALLLVTGCTAHAQAFDAVRIFGPVDANGKGTIGAAVINSPEFLGSKQRRTMLLPALEYRWQNGFFAGTTNGIGYQFSSAPNMQYGLRVTADFGRDADKSAALKGMGDIDAAAEFGGFFNYFVSPQVSLTSSLRYGAGNDHNGMVIDLGANYAMQFAPQWRGAVGVATTFANSNTMQDRFGVTPAQAITSGYAPYTPASGLRDARISASANYFFSRQVAITGAVSASALLGDAKNSPIVRSKSAVTGVLAVSYEF
jgi:MipA family protein